MESFKKPSHIMQSCWFHAIDNEYNELIYVISKIGPKT